MSTRERAADRPEQVHHPTTEPRRENLKVADAQTDIGRGVPAQSTHLLRERRHGLRLPSFELFERPQIDYDVCLPAMAPKDLRE